MTTEDKYIETNWDVIQWKVDEWAGRCWAAKNGELYPIPSKSQNFRTNGYYYAYAVDKENTPGGVLVLDETLLSFSGMMQQLSDASYLAIDLPQWTKTYDELSDEAKAVVPAPPPPEEESPAAETPVEVTTPDVEPSTPDVEAPASPEQQPSDATSEQWEDL